MYLKITLILFITKDVSRLDISLMLTLIDGILIISVYYGVRGRLSRSDGTPVNAVYGFCNMILPLLADAKSTDRFFASLIHEKFPQ